jgi:SEC-C motif
MPPGRNDPCPCGSGLKHKKCCLAKERLPSDPASLLWRRLNAVDENQVLELLRFARRGLGEDVLIRSSKEFFGTAGTPADSSDPEMEGFVPWMLYCRRIPTEDWLRDAPTKRGTIASAYLERHASRLDAFARGYLDACMEEPYSFYEVIDVTPGQGLEVEDVLRGGRRYVSERTASGTLRPRELVWAHVISFEGLNLFAGIGSIPLEPIRKLEIIDLAARLRRWHPRITTAILRRDEAWVRGTYVALRDRALHPKIPILQNTDGDALSLHRLTFRIDDAAAAFEALADLDILASREELLERAERDRSGKLVKAHIDWEKLGNARLPSRDNTILGHLKIENQTLVVEVNSRQRAERIRKEIEKRLGTGVLHERTVITSPERVLAEGRPPKPDSEADKKQALLLADPAIRSAIKQQLEKHYESWADEKIPALGGKTPRQAVKTVDGRAKVETILASGEERSVFNDPTLRLDLDFVREQLGLPRSRKNAK